MQEETCITLFSLFVLFKAKQILKIENLENWRNWGKFCNPRGGPDTLEDTHRRKVADTPLFVKKK